MNAIADIAPIVGLLFFFVVFLWIAFEAYRPGAKRKWEQCAAIPLKEDNNG